MFAKKSDVVKYIKKNKIEMVDLMMVDLVGRIRHLTMPAARCDEAFLGEGFGFDASNYGFKSVEKSDMVVLPDISTAFRDPFRKAPTLTMFGEVWSVDGKEHRFADDLRGIAKRTEELVRKRLGGEMLLGPEYEFYVFEGLDCACGPVDSGFRIRPAGGDLPSGVAKHAVSRYHIAPPADRFADFRDEAVNLLEAAGVEVKYHHHEVGALGQMEIETSFGPILRMCDATVLVKYFIRNLAQRQGLYATFMPKPLFGHAGSGLHVHFKLTGPKGNHPFADAKGYAGLSRLAHQFMGGILDHAAPLAGFTNPSTNSYRRLVKGFEAPTAIAYAESNRSAAIRIPGYVKEPCDKRFEYRSGDATANPYLMFSALVAAGLDGVARKVDPEKAGYGPFDMNIYDLPEEIRARVKFLPDSLDTALAALRRDGGFLVESGLFSKQLLEAWIEQKTRDEVAPMRELPHPYEFILSADL